MKRRLEVNGVIIALAVLLIAFFPGMFLRSGTGYYNMAVKLAGISLIILGQIFRVSARGYKAEHSRQGGRLIRGGPYSLVRNPMYLGILLIGMGVVLFLFKWWAACVFLGIFALRYILLIFTEEKKLLGLFPQEYPLYCKQVPRLVPNPLPMLKKGIKEYLPVKSYWLKKELGTMLAVLLPALFIDAWLVIRNYGKASYLNEVPFVSAAVLLFICFMIYLGRGEGGSKQETSVKN